MFCFRSALNKWLLYFSSVIYSIDEVKIPIFDCEYEYVKFLQIQIHIDRNYTVNSSVNTYMYYYYLRKCS